MKLIVGLGNPGKEYDQTRHNVGYMTVTSFANKYNAVFKLDTKLKGEVATTIINGEKVMLLKPTTYMNLSGDSIILVLNYYKIDVKDMIVIHDDLDLPVGALRLKTHGSAGGHNGLKSIINHIGNTFNRAKIGISKSDDVIAHVLGKFSKDEAILINNAIDKACNAIDDFISNKSFDELMNKYN